jgi:hypothetical protein
MSELKTAEEKVLKYFLSEDREKSPFHTNFTFPDESKLTLEEISNRISRVKVPIYDQSLSEMERFQILSESMNEVEDILSYSDLDEPDKLKLALKWLWSSRSTFDKMILLHGQKLKYPSQAIKMGKVDFRQICEGSATGGVGFWTDCYDSSFWCSVCAIVLPKVNDCRCTLFACYNNLNASSVQPGYMESFPHSILQCQSGSCRKIVLSGTVIKKPNSGMVKA